MLTWSSRSPPTATRWRSRGFDVADQSGGARVPLWLRGELSVARADGVLVLVDGTPAEADAVASA